MKDSKTKVRNVLLMVALCFLAIHLFGTHSRLLYRLNTVWTHGDATPFSFVHLNETGIVSIISAIAYSVMTAIILKLFNFTLKSFAIIVAPFAILDFFGILIYYNTTMENFTQAGAWYYAFYTLAIIFGIASASMSDTQPEPQLTPPRDTPVNERQVEKEILRLKNSGISQKEIAAQLLISESKVCRIIKKSINRQL